MKKVYPELANFDEKLSPLLFYFCDLDHNGRIDPFEFISSLVTYSAMGTEEEKARFLYLI